MNKPSLKQRLLPPSSASFHGFERRIMRRVEDIDASVSRNFDTIINRTNEITAKLDEITGLLCNQRDQIVHMNNRIDVLQRQVHYYSSAVANLCMNNKKNGGALESRIELFKNLPPATGKMRLCQRLTTKLMCDLDEILRKNHIKYWIAYGSLLGAYTRNSCIPWDDDIDICIPRDGLEKLKHIVAKNKKYCITSVYDRYVLCGQYRFYPIDKNIPAFIDLCVWDYTIDYGDDVNDYLNRLRQSLEDALVSADLPYWNQQKYIYMPGDSGIGIQACGFVGKQDDEKARSEYLQIARLFEEYRNKAIKDGIITDNPSKAKGISYSIDGMSVYHPRMSYAVKSVFPTKDVMFEGFNVETPRDTEKLLTDSYGDWPIIPGDESLLENRHFDKGVLDEPEINTAIEEFLNK